MASADYSKLTKGVRVQAEYDGKYYSAEVLEVSTSKKRAKAPVKVHFIGHDDGDEWLGADRLRSKLIKQAKTEAPKKEEKGKKDKGKKAKEAPKKERPPLEFEMGYWKIRGLGAVFRMIFEFKGAKYTDHQYGDGLDWFGPNKDAKLEKNTLANLPWVQCGGTVVCQTNAALGFVGSRLRLNGQGPARLKNDQLLCEVYDTRNAMIETVYPFKKVCRDKKEYEAHAKKLCEGGPFKKFESWLEAQKTDFFCGAKPCTSDFHIWEMLDQYHKLAQTFKIDIFKDIPKCKEFYDRFRALPTLQKYFESDDYKLPCNNQAAGAYFA